jgi:molybdenum cofactor synthesis domain-containing protein
MNAALLTVGDEILAGDTTNTNATWLAEQLANRGVSVKRVLTVPDEVSIIADATRRYNDAFDAVIVTGGLGGTHDDVTMAGVASAFDRDLVANDLAMTDIERTLEGLTEEYPDLDVGVEAEAAIPEGARPLLNQAGLSPGCVLESVHVLPGIPSEMKRMFEDIADSFDGDMDSRLLYTEEPEANLIDRLEEVRERFGVQVGCYPDREAGHNRLKLTGTDQEALSDATAWLGEQVALVE